MQIPSSRLIYLGDPEGTADHELGVHASASHRVITRLQEIRGAAPIYLVINTFGGEDDHSRAIIDAIETDKRDIVGVVYGRAQSAGAWILQACDWRILMPRSNLMLHMGGSDKTDHSDWADRMFVDDVLRRVNEKDPAYPRNKLIRNLKKDWYIYPTQAVELGLADEVYKGGRQ